MTNIDQDPSRPGFQWRFTVDISRTGETVDTFMAFIKWVDQATIDAYRAANLPLVDLTGDPITKPGWVDFTRIAPGGDGVTIGSSSGNILFLDYTITDNAFGDRLLRDDKKLCPCRGESLEFLVYQHRETTPPVL